MEATTILTRGGALLYPFVLTNIAGRSLVVSCKKLCRLPMKSP